MADLLGSLATVDGVDLTVLPRTGFWQRLSAMLNSHALVPAVVPGAQQIYMATSSAMSTTTLSMLLHLKPLPVTLAGQTVKQRKSQGHDTVPQARARSPSMPPLQERRHKPQETPAAQHGGANLKVPTLQGIGRHDHSDARNASAQSGTGASAPPGTAQ